MYEFTDKEIRKKYNNKSFNKPQFNLQDISRKKF